MSINLSSNPYFDDFEAKKNYVKILFKPSYAVQSRELTQLQTALQAQISRFGTSIYKDGSIVLGGQLSRVKLSYIDIETTSLTELVDKSFTGNTDGAKGKTFLLVQLNDTVARLYYTPINGLYFEQNETITSSSFVQYEIVDVADFGGVAEGLGIAESVFYVKSHFVYCEPQRIILYHQYDLTVAEQLFISAGLDILEEVVTYLDDSTLLDPAQGSYNFAAPGADRYTIGVTLNSYSYNPALGTPDRKDFIELARFQNGKIIHQVTHASYSDLETTLARRTYDQSGDYTVRPFYIKVKDYVHPEIDGSADKVTVAIDSGKAYVKGYEFETVATTNLSMDKARDTESRSGRQVQVDFGDYFIVNTPAGAALDYTTNPTIDLRNVSNAVIGTARVRAILPMAASVYRLYVYNIDMTGTNSTELITNFISGSWTATLNTGAYTLGQPRLVRSNRRSFIVPLPNANIKTLLPSDTTFVAHRRFATNIPGSQTTINTGSVDEVFLSNENIDYMVVNNATGGLLTVTVVSGTGSSKTITIAENNVDVAIYTIVGVSQAIHKTKSLVVGTLSNVVATTAEISLVKSDCFKLTSVTLKDSTLTLANRDFTNFFTFNNGQKDHMYDYGTVQLKSGASIPAGYDRFDIEFSYFTQNTPNGFFSVDSYTAAASYTDIPTYKSTSGISYSLGDCLDFRPRRDNSNSALIVGGYTAVTNRLSTSDYEYYLSRIDKLVLTKDRKFHFIKGVPAEVPSIPNDSPDAMTLYVLRIPAYTHKADDVTFTYIDNKRYTMRDIGKIEKRVERVEYYTALSLLEKQAKDETITDGGGLDKFKNGILVDSFAGHSVGAVDNTDYACSIDQENRLVRPRFAPYGFEYKVNTLTGLKQKGDLITLPYDDEVFISQPFATNFNNVNPYLVFHWNGHITLSPATDTWVDTFVRPDVMVNMNGENDVYTSVVDNVANPASIGVRWNDWQMINRGVVIDDNFNTNISSAINQRGNSVFTDTTSTTINKQTTTVNETMYKTGLEIATSQVTTVRQDLGNRIVDTSIIPFIRSRVIQFQAKRLKPNTKLTAFFDNVDVSEYCTPAMEMKIVVNEANRTATKIRSSGGVKEAVTVMVKSNLLFFIMDDNKAVFNNTDAIQFLVNGAWLSNTALPTSIYLSPDLETNEFGDISGIFNIPNNDSIRFNTGEKPFRLADGQEKQTTTAAETKYVASGMSQSMERLITATRVSSVSINPVNDSYVKSRKTRDDIVVGTETVSNRIQPHEPPPMSRPLIDCNGGSVDGRGRRGRFAYNINFGVNTGTCSLTYATGDVPDRYTLEWDGKTYTTGFVGSNTFDNALNKIGFPKTVGTGSGTLSFNKTKHHPTNARLIVDAPLSGTDWSFNISQCPATVPPVKPRYSIMLTPGEWNVRDGVGGWLWTGRNGSTPFSTMQMTVRLNAGTSGSKFGRVTLTHPVNVGGGTMTITPSELVLRNGQSQQVTVRIDGDTVRRNITITGNVTEYNDAGGSVLSEWHVDSSTSTARHNRTITTPNISTAVWDWGGGGDGDGGGDDPVAQTFFVNSRRTPFGIFVNKIDLFFKKKSNSYPVQVQLRPVVNGYPSSSTVLPFGICDLEPADVNISTTGTVATTFEFENIVHLAPGEYCFVVLSDTDEYEIFTAKLGEYSLSNPEERVVEQPTLGSMFKSQNSTTWTATQEENVKYTLYKCIFDSIQGTVTLDTDIQPATGDIDYDVFYTTGETVEFDPTQVTYQFNPGTGTWSNYQLGTNHQLTAPRTLVDDTPASLQFRATMMTFDSNVTPIIDLNRMTSRLVNNIVNNDITNEQLPYGGAADAKYITRTVNLAPGMEAKDLRVYFNANLPSGTSVKVYYKVGAMSDENIDVNHYIEMNLKSAGSFSEIGFTEYQYETQWGTALQNEEPFNAFAVKIVMLAEPTTTNVPRIRDLRVIALDD